MQSLIIFALGLSVGSFLNVLIYRLPKDQDFIASRSKCTQCRKNLVWYDLIPILSQLFLRGKCRYCKTSIPLRYPLVELLAAFSFLFLFLTTYQATLSSFLSLTFWLATISLLIVIIFIDLDYLLILDKILLVLGGIAAVYVFFRSNFIKQEPAVYNSSFSFIGNLGTAIFSAAFFLAIYFASKKRGIGLGDVKLIFLLGFIFGFPGILFVVYLSLAAGAILSLALVCFHGAGLKTKLPFGSILAGASIIFILFGKLFVPFFLPYIFRLYI